MSLEKLDTCSEPSVGLDAESEKEQLLEPISEEEQILESISELRLEIFRIETTTGPSNRTNCIRNEIRRLESQLACSKDQA